MNRFVLLKLAVLLALLGLALPLTARAEADGDDIKSIREKAIAFLKKNQAEDGSYSNKFGPGVTALVVAGLIKNGVAEDDPTLAKALKSLESHVKPDGGIYDKRLQNYTTCVAIMALAEANKDKKYEKILKNATAFLKKLQADDPAGKDLKFGGVGYDGKGRPDLSNTQFFIDSLIAAGVPKDDPAIQRALKFVTRCQNFADKEKGNDQPFAAKAREEDKGGFTYVPLDSDDNKHRTTEGGLRSLGAMTYAGLKSFLYAGVKKDDPRVVGAIKWIRANYTLEENPGEGQGGLFYYYHTFAKAMDALGEEEFKDSKGKAHPWRKDLLAALKKRQLANGSFLNKADKAFGEADPNLATAFALLSLSYCSKK
jgi:squalene-hopene/tetraprenyl-beta-curcumene cyclase